jgi:hypothetical protein
MTAPHSPGLTPGQDVPKSKAGGADIGPFTATRTVSQLLTLKGGIPATVDHTKNLTLSWTGENPTDLVMMLGISSTAIGGTNSNPMYDVRVLVCTTTASRGPCTVSAGMLSQVPATAANNGSGIGYMQSELLNSARSS